MHTTSQVRMILRILMGAGEIHAKCPRCRAVLTGSELDTRRHTGCERVTGWKTARFYDVPQVGGIQ